jgi:type I restriction enzyme S subunit
MVMPGYKQTEIGVIPEDWEDKKLGDVGKVCMCKRIFADQTSDTGEIPFFKIGTFGKEADAYISRELYEDFKRRFSYPQRGDVLISAAGTLGRSVVFDGKDSYFQDSNIVWLDIDKEQLCNEYLYHYYKVIQWASAEGSTIARLYNGIICNTHIAVPDVEEQKKIANVLSDVDELIFLTEKQLSKKKAIKQGAMQELLTCKKRLPGFSGEWQTFVFGELFDFIPNNAFTRAQMSDNGKVKNIHYGDILTKYGAYVDGNSNAIPYISKEVDLSRFADRCYLQSGDIIIADTAEDEAVGKALEVINVDCPILAGQHTLLCRPKIKFAEKFLGYYLNAACYHDQLIPYIVGTKVSSVSKASVAQTKLVVPEYEEQQAIAEILSNMDAEIEALQQKLEKYRQIKQGMMQQLLTGKIRLV